MRIMEKKRREMKKEFLSLTPFERIKTMNTIFNDIISLKAKTKGLKEYEIYREYIKKDIKLIRLTKQRKTQKAKEDRNQLIL